MDEAWTLAELVQRAIRALAEADVRAPNGRVTEVPDARMIRWYTTTGLLDRPVMRGRVATYGERHLLQLVAVKRLQAAGLTLAEIQQRLAGAPDAALKSAAAGASTRHPILERAEHPFPVTPPAIVIAPLEPAPDEEPPERPRFWANPSRAAARPSRGGATSSALDSGRDSVSDADHLLYGLRIHDLTLLLRARPDEADLPAIRAAAQPLIDLLAARKLMTPSPTSSEKHSPSPNPSDDRKGGPA